MGIVLAALLTAFSGDLYQWIKGGVTPDGDPVLIDKVSVHIPPEPGAAFAGEFTATAEDLKVLNGDPAKFGEWVRRNKGVGFTDSQSISIILGGNRDHKVRVTGMSVVKDACRAPLAGTLFYSPTAGSADSRELSFDLDAPGSTVTSGYFAKRHITLGRGEQETFNIMTPSKNQFCSFRIQATILDGSKSSTLTIDDGGQPFTATAGLEDVGEYQYLYVGGVASCPPGGWSRQPPKRFAAAGSSEEACLPAPTP
ncbi:hypothetical protein ACH4U5_38235 [Streptomyces sp. NPDC020858]|uniref:hypothetical protein n=1 Tax=Streptomyces sp. NPDC020858 TaxID=3365097 RepID=UPI0037A5954B